MRLLRWCQLSAFLLLTAGFAAPLAAQNASASADAQLQITVQRKIGDLKIKPPINVSVQGGIVTVDGTVPNLWTKMQIIDAARKTPGVTRVDSTIAIANPESDAKLAEAVAKAITTYSRLSMFDLVDGSVKDGVVALSGKVTDPLKKDELTERIEKVSGVKDISGGISVLPLSQMDDRIRNAIGTRIYSDPDFINYSRADPPVRIIVENGRVTLVGIVASDLERRKAEIAARGVNGVFSVDNKIQLSSELRGGAR